MAAHKTYRYKLEVDSECLNHLLQRIGREDLIAQTQKKICQGRIDPEWRDSLICLLVQRDDVSEQEVGDCFGLSRAHISNIAKKHSVKVVPKKSIRERGHGRLKYLTTPEGRKVVEEVMTRVATEEGFWATSGSAKRKLRKPKVLQCLGFPQSTDTHLMREFWHSLVNTKIIEEELLAGIALRYGLHVDPQKFIEQHYEGASLKDVAATINEMGKAVGLVFLSEKALRYYMIMKGISLKPRGRP